MDRPRTKAADLPIKSDQQKRTEPAKETQARLRCEVPGVLKHVGNLATQASAAYLQAGDGSFCWSLLRRPWNRPGYHRRV